MIMKKNMEEGESDTRLERLKKPRRQDRQQYEPDWKWVGVPPKQKSRALPLH